MARLGIVVEVCMIYMDVAGGGEQVEQEEEGLEAALGLPGPQTVAGLSLREKN